MFIETAIIKIIGRSNIINLKLAIKIFNNNSGYFSKLITKYPNISIGKNVKKLNSFFKIIYLYIKNDMRNIP